VRSRTAGIFCGIYGFCGFCGFCGLDMNAGVIQNLDYM